jgi:hypothetical protein
MKYNAPFGSADPNAPFVDRNTPGAVSGSRVPAAAIEDPQREIMAVIAAGGITPSDADLTQLLQAIQQLISAATGGGDTSNFVLMPQARARLPIFPEVLRSDGMIPVISPSTGQVRVPAGVDFLHRGIFTVTTVQTDFATAASKIYHLRWAPTGGFVLKDLADPAYNPGALVETSAVFDSTYDDMLVARVVTSAGNAPTVTNLINKDRLSSLILQNQTITRVCTSIGHWVAAFSPIAINWARTPQASGAMARTGFTGVLTIVPEEPALVLNGSSADNTGSANASVTRYNFSPIGTIDLNESSPVSRTFGIQLSATLVA